VIIYDFSHVLFYTLFQKIAILHISHFLLLSLNITQPGRFLQIVKCKQRETRKSKNGDILHEGEYCGRQTLIAIHGPEGIACAECKNLGLKNSLR